MSQAFEYVQMGEEFCQEQRLHDAERAFQRAIQAYEKQKDVNGVAYVLGRMGNCYEQGNEVDKAIKTYRRAVELKTDIPAIYSNLISLLVEQSALDEAFYISGQWHEYGQRHINEPVYQIFINLGARLIRKKRYEEAITLLSRTVEAISVQNFPNEHWAAKGQLGYAYEKAGNTDAAMNVFTTAIKNGSNDRQTYTRYIMYLEKTKQYEQALHIIKKGLKIQHDAAWEVDLRKRQQRIERKTGYLPKDTVPKIIPVFSIRHGEKSISLIHQVKFSPQLTNVTVGQGIAYATSGGKNPKLSAWQIDTAAMDWQIDLPEAADGIVVTPESIVTYAQQGRIGNGLTILHFLDLAGNEASIQRLPDAPSQIVTDNEHIYVGCRDGKLYAFSRWGKRLWSYRVPGSKDYQESAYTRPSPYYISTTSNFVVFSSFSNIFALNTEGHLLWQWSVPERQLTSQSNGVTFATSLRPASVSGLATPADGSRVVITAKDIIYELVNGRVNSQIKCKNKILANIALDSTGTIWAIGANEQVIILQDQKVVGRFSTPQRVKLNLDANADRVIAWSDKKLIITSLTGEITANIEFVKKISHTQCINDRKVVVGAGHLIILDIPPQLNPSESKPAKHESNPNIAQRDKPTKQPLKCTEEQGIPIRWIEGEKLPTEKGKARFMNSEGQPLTIEQFALEHYSQLGWKGTWTENKYWWTIMALLFWDVIFAQLPGVFTPGFGEFPNTIQDMPIDFFSPDFYPRRKELIKKRIAELTQSKLFGLRKANIEAELKSAFRRHKDRPCRAIDWTRQTKVDSLLIATKVLTDQQLIQIMHRLLVNFSHYRSGLPDLFLTHEGKPLFSEVKSEKERVASHQIDWMLYLKNNVGVSVEICRVIAKK